MTNPTENDDSFDIDNTKPAADNHLDVDDVANNHLDVDDVANNHLDVDKKRNTFPEIDPNVESDDSDFQPKTKIKKRKTSRKKESNEKLARKPVSVTEKKPVAPEPQFGCCST